MVKYVIIGNGVAGTTAAEHIRKRDEDGTITLLTQESYPFYSRIRLIDFLSNDATEQDLFLRKESWYKNQRIDVMLNTIVTQIDPQKKRVITQENDTLDYDKLLLATGGVSFIPPIPGVKKRGVFTLRTIQDAIAIKEYTKKEGNKIILIGGGILGLEAGNALRKNGCDVTIIEFFPRLLPRQMDPEGAHILQAQLESQGFTFYLGAKTQEINGKKHVTGITLDSGTFIEGNLVLLSAGIRPDASLAENLGLEIDRGVVVKDTLETSLQNIYAAGDLIQHRDTFYGIWPAAEKQGRVAGINMAGGNMIYPGTTMSNTLKVAGIDLVSSGDIDPEGQQVSIVKKDEEDFIYKKIVLADNKIIGAILYGDTRGRNKILKAIQEKKGYRSLS